MSTESNFFKSVGALALATGLLLLVPLVGMQFSDEIVWTLSDFIIAGVLLFGTGLAYTVVTHILAPLKGDNLIYRVAVGLALLTGLFLVWANLAVGVIGSEDNPANLMYYGVIAVGLIGAAWSRFKPLGMMRTMFAMAIAQSLIAAIALLSGMHLSPVSSIPEIINVNGFFVTLFVVSALLFRHAAQEQVESESSPSL